MSDFILYMPYVCKHPTAYENHKISRNALLSARDLSSAGRASALQAEGHRFEPYRSHFYAINTAYARVAELADAQDLKSCCGDTVPVRFRSRALTERSKSKYVCVAQLDRALGYGPRCRGFESSHAREKSLENCWFSRLFLFCIKRKPCLSYLSR